MSIIVHLDLSSFFNSVSISYGKQVNEAWCLFLPPPHKKRQLLLANMCPIYNTWEVKKLMLLSSQSKSINRYEISDSSLAVSI